MKRMQMRLAVAGMVVWGLGLGVARAATLDWNPAGGAGASGDWDQTTANWWDGDANVAWDNANLDVAQFLSFASGGLTNTLTEAITAHRLVLSTGSGDVTLTGTHTLTLDRDGVSGPDALTVPSGRTLLVENAIAFTGGQDQWLVGSGLFQIDGDISGSSRLRSHATIRLSGDNSNHSGGWWTRTATFELASDTAWGTGTVQLGDRSGGNLTVRALDGVRTASNNLAIETRHNEQIWIRTFDGDLIFTGNLTVSRSFVETSSTNLFTVNAINGSTTFSGDVASTGVMRLDKRGAGALVFEHATAASSDAFPEGVDIREGTLLINSPFTGQGNYRVGFSMTGNATLGGTGSISLASGKRVTVEGTSEYTATLAPGNSIGTLTVDGDVVFGDYGVLRIAVDGAAGSTLAVDGDLDLSSTLNTLELVGTPMQAYTIATYTGDLTGTFANEPTLPSGYVVDYGTGSDSEIVIWMPPPPGSLFLMR